MFGFVYVELSPFPVVSVSTVINNEIFCGCRKELKTTSSIVSTYGVRVVPPWTCLILMMFIEFQGKRAYLGI